MRITLFLILLLSMSCGIQLDHRVQHSKSKENHHFEKLKNNPFTFYGPYNGSKEFKSNLPTYAFNSNYKNLQGFRNKMAVSLSKAIERSFSKDHMVFGTNRISKEIITGKDLSKVSNTLKSEKTGYTVVISDFKLYETEGKIYQFFKVDRMILDVDILIYKNQNQRLLEKVTVSSNASSNDLEAMQKLIEAYADNFIKLIEYNGLLAEPKKLKN